MPRFKATLDQKITFRISEEVKSLVEDICRRDNLHEAELVRICVEAAIQIAEQSGVSEIMRIREQLGLGKRARVTFAAAKD